VTRLDCNARLPGAILPSLAPGLLCPLFVPGRGQTTRQVVASGEKPAAPFRLYW